MDEGILWGGGEMMCGSSYYYQKTKSEIWRVSGDKKHISFYAERDDCVGSTRWCKEHCYLENKPFPPGFENIKPFYNRDHFSPENIQDQDFGKVFMKADFITFFASGSVDSLLSPLREGYVSYAIGDLIAWHPTKKFRFFIRKEMDKRTKIRPNAIVIFSVDRDTEIENIDYAIKSDTVNHISIVNHRDNKPLLFYLKSKIGNIISCKKCNEDNYLCFKKKNKSLLIMEYQEANS